jgi:hypothetical protein
MAGSRTHFNIAVFANERTFEAKLVHSLLVHKSTSKFLKFPTSAENSGVNKPDHDCD